MYTYTLILFVPLSLDRHLGCLRFLAIVNNVGITLEYKYLFKFLLSILLSKYPEMELLDLTLLTFVLSVLFPVPIEPYYLLHICWINILKNEWLNE